MQKITHKISNNYRLTKTFYNIKKYSDTSTTNYSYKLKKLIYSPYNAFLNFLGILKHKICNIHINIQNTILSKIHNFINFKSNLYHQMIHKITQITNPDNATKHIIAIIILFLLFFTVYFLYLFFIWSIIQINYIILEFFFLHLAISSEFQSNKTSGTINHLTFSGLV